MEEPVNAAAPPAPPSLIVPQPLAQAIVNYLQTKPFQEVHEIIAQLVRCAVQPAPAPSA